MASADLPPGAVPTSAMPDPFTGSPSFHAQPAPVRYAAFDSEHFSLASTNSPSSARRALEAHLKNTDRRIREASKLGTTLIQQRTELALRLQEVEQMQADSEVPEGLRAKLSELEREYNEVGRESARAFLPKSRVVSETADPTAGSGIISGNGRESPTKAQAPSMSRRHRNQQSHRVHDIEFATEISTSLIAQVRQLQAALAEKDDELRDTAAAKAQLEAEAAHLLQRLRHMDENEQKYKDENWNLETRLQDTEASLKQSMDKETRLAQSLKSTQVEKAAKERELDELKVSHDKLNEDHAMATRMQEADLHGLKRDAAIHETEKSRLEKRIAELVSQNTELAKAVSYRMHQSAQQSETDFVSADEGIQSDEQSAMDSAPPSPVKGTPLRHGMLEQETMRSSLNHAHRMIQNLKNTIHREKTEKIELKRMLQDARDELETKRDTVGVGANMAKKRRSEPEGIKFKRPSTNRLGATRNSTTEILEDEPDWEDHDIEQTPSKPRSFGAATGAVGRAVQDRMYRSEDDTTDAFETANERETTTESDAFATGNESLGDDTDGDLTETEGGGNSTLRSFSSITSRPHPEHRQSYMSTASMSGDEDDDIMKTPMHNVQQPKYKLRLSRGVRRSGRVSDIAANSPTAASNNSPASSSGTPMHAQQTLGDELDALDEDSMEGTPASSRITGDEGTPLTSRELSMEPDSPTKAGPVPSAAEGAALARQANSAVLAHEIAARKPEMVDSGMMTEPWDPERANDHSLRERSGELVGGALAGLGISRLRSQDIDGSHTGNVTDQAPMAAEHEVAHDDISGVLVGNEVDFPSTRSSSGGAVGGLQRLNENATQTQVHLPAQFDTSDVELEKYKSEIEQLHASLESESVRHKSEMESLQNSRISDHEQYRSELEKLRQIHSSDTQEYKHELERLQKSHNSEIEHYKHELEQLRKKHDEALEQHFLAIGQLQQSHSTESDQYKQELEQLREAHVETTKKQNTALQQLQVAHDDAKKQHSIELQQLQEMHNEAREQHSLEMQQFQKLHDDAREQHDLESLQLHKTLEETIEQHSLKLLELQKLHDDTREQHGMEVQQLQKIQEQTNEQHTLDMQQLRKQHSDTAERYEAELELLRKNHDGATGQFVSQLAQLQQLQKSKDEQIEQHKTEIEQLVQSQDAERQQHVSKVEQLTQEHTNTELALEKLRVDSEVQLQHFKHLLEDTSTKLITSQNEKEELQQKHNRFSQQHEDLQKQHLDVQSKHAQAQETIRILTPEPVSFAFSPMVAQDLEPVEAQVPLVPRRSSKRLEPPPADGYIYEQEHEPKTLLDIHQKDRRPPGTDAARVGAGFFAGTVASALVRRRSKSMPGQDRNVRFADDHALGSRDDIETNPVTNDDGRRNSFLDNDYTIDESPVDPARYPRRPLAEMSANPAPTRPPPPVPMTDEGSQTVVSARDIDSILRNKTAISSSASPVRTTAISGAATAAALSAFAISSTRGRSADIRPSIYESPTLKTPNRPSSSGSVRSKGMTGAPPLPSDHTKKIAEAQKAPGTPTGQASSSTMGPPTMPASAYKQRPLTRDRPLFERTGSRDSTTPRQMPMKASRSQMASDRVSHRTSVSSFASELDVRFNITRGQVMYPNDIEVPTDPRMIQAITQTMIGEYLWKYTRKAGRSETSNTRHRRFFWVHPYTRTLYWSEQDPSTAGKNMLKAKSVAINEVRVISDDNAYPPGLHRKTLVVVTPGREIHFTAATAQRHETWFNALSYLLMRTNKEKTEAEDTFDESDLDEFRPGFGRSVRRSISRMTGPQRSSSRLSRDGASLSSYNSRTTRTISPQRHDPDRTLTGRLGTVTQQSRSLQPPTATNDLTETVTNNNRQSSSTITGRFNSLASRFRPGSSQRVRSSASMRVGDGILDPASIYDASVVADSAEDLRAVIEQQEREADRLENVRACCDGKHDVGSLSKKQGRFGSHGHAHHSTSHHSTA